MTADFKITQIEKKRILKIGNDLFELSTIDGNPHLQKLPIWKKLSLSEPLFARVVDAGHVVISARGKSDVVIDRVSFDVLVSLFDDPADFVGFDPGLCGDISDTQQYDAGVTVSARPVNHNTCSVCFGDMTGRQTFECRQCGKTVCGHCILKSCINKYREDLCTDCYYQRRAEELDEIDH